MCIQPGVLLHCVAVCDCVVHSHAFSFTLWRCVIVFCVYITRCSLSLCGGVLLCCIQPGVRIQCVAVCSVCISPGVLLHCVAVCDCVLCVYRYMFYFTVSVCGGV